TNSCLSIDGSFRHVRQVIVSQAICPAFQDIERPGTRPACLPGQEVLPNTHDCTSVQEFGAAVSVAQYAFDFCAQIASQPAVERQQESPLGTMHNLRRKFGPK